MLLPAAVDEFYRDAVTEFSGSGWLDPASMPALLVDLLEDLSRLTGLGLVSARVETVDGTAGVDGWGGSVLVVLGATRAIDHAGDRHLVGGGDLLVTHGHVWASPRRRGTRGESVLLMARTTTDDEPQAAHLESAEDIDQGDAVQLETTPAGAGPRDESGTPSEAAGSPCDEVYVGGREEPAQAR